MVCWQIEQYKHVAYNTVRFISANEVGMRKEYWKSKERKIWVISEGRRGNDKGNIIAFWAELKTHLIFVVRSLKWNLSAFVGGVYTYMFMHDYFLESRPFNHPGPSGWSSLLSTPIANCQSSDPSRKLARLEKELGNRNG